MEHFEALKKYLKENKVEFEVLHHEVAYTALETAAAQHVPGKQLLKSVIVKAPKGYCMCVLPSVQRLDFDKFRDVCGKGESRLATEEEIAELFPECEVGAEPPFGHWQGLPVYCEESIGDEAEIVFNAGTHTKTIKMSFEDYKRLAHPTMAPLGIHV